MRNLGLATVLGVTCLAGYLFGTRRLGLTRASLRAAGAATLEAIGLSVAFLVVNLALAFLPLLAARALTGRFVSLYGIDHGVIAAVSLLQGLVLRWWRVRG